MHGRRASGGRRPLFPGVFTPPAASEPAPTAGSGGVCGAEPTPMIHSTTPAARAAIGRPAVTRGVAGLSEPGMVHRMRLRFEAWRYTKLISDPRISNPSRDDAADQGMDVRSAWGDAAMRERYVRRSVVVLLLAIPWLIAAADPAAPGGRLGPALLTDLVMVLGLLWASHQRRVILLSRGRARLADPAVPAEEPARVGVRCPASVVTLT